MQQQLSASSTGCLSLAENIAISESWFDVWLEAFGGGQSGIWRPRSRDSDLKIPYQLSKIRGHGLGWTVISAAANAHTPRYDILGEFRSPKAELSEMMRELGASMVVFPFLSPACKLLSAVRDRTWGLRYSLEPCEAAPYIVTTGSWEEYWASRGRSRREWARRERRLLEQDSNRVVCLTSWDQVGAIFRSILEIEASGWKGKEGSAIVQSETIFRFYSRLAQQWSNDEHLRFFVLYQGDQPVAFELDAEFKGILHCFKHGYLDNLSRKGPGQVLRMQVLRWAFNNPAVIAFDMFGPETDAKRKWATHSEQLLTLRVYRSRPAGVLAWGRFSLGPRIKGRVLGFKRGK